LTQYHYKLQLVSVKQHWLWGENALELYHCFTFLLTSELCGQQVQQSHITDVNGVILFNPGVNLEKNEKFL